MRSLLHQIDPLTGRLRNIILLGAIACAMLASSRADAQCLPAPASVRGPSGPTADLRPTFSWDGVQGAFTYTLYILTVAGDQVVLRQTGIHGTSFTPAKTLPTTLGWLRWKVKAEGACGAGAYRDGNQFLLGAGDSCPPTEPPGLIEPQEGDITNPAPQFCWDAVPGAQDYVLALLYADDDGDYVFGHAFTASVTCVNLGPLPVNTPMRWKVKARCNGLYGPFSPSRYFTVVQ